MKRDEQQEQELVKYLDDVGEVSQESDLACGFIDGWDTADRTMIDKACKWLENDFEELTRLHLDSNVIEQFRQAMKN